MIEGQWDRCYEDQWKGFITTESFAHPAKYARGLITRIFEYMLQEGMIQKGDTCIDPFGGIGCGGVIAAGMGIRWIGCELEEKFYKMALENFSMHRETWEKFNDPLPTILNGDSRKLREVIRENADALASSPPYNLPMSQDHNGARGGSRGTEPSETGAFVKYGNTPGQLEGLAMGSIDQVVSSPPFSGMEQPCASQARTIREGGYDAIKAPTKQDKTLTTGTEGQLGSMETGTVHSVISSPPYEGNVNSDYRIEDEDGNNRDQRRGFRQGTGCFRGSETYGKTEGNLGAMESGTVDSVVGTPPFLDARSDTTPSIKGESAPTKHDPEAWSGVEAIISSPPYAESSVAKSSNGIDKTKQYETYRKSGGGMSYEAFVAQQERHSGDYGTSDGQLSKLSAGSIDAVISSPPYAESLKGSNEETETAAESLSKRKTPGGPMGQSCRHSGYGGKDNLGNLPAGELDAVVSSPPYTKAALGHGGGEGPRTTNASHSKPGTENSQTYGDHKDNIGNMREGSVDAVVSSPPYANDTVHARGEEREAQVERMRKAGYSEEYIRGNFQQPNSNMAMTDYGETSGQLGHMKEGEIDSVVSSPPYEGSETAGVRDLESKAEHLEAAGIDSKTWLGKARCSQIRTEHYGNTNGQLGREEGETFWSASKQIVSECYHLLKPGAWTCWVVKRFVRDKQIVDFPGDWCRLLEACGFKIERRIRAMLTIEERNNDLFGGVEVKSKARKSFFRRLYESKYPENSIDWEDVIFARKV